MKKVSEFLKVEINDDLIDRIVDKCHIDKMRYMDKDVDNAKRFLVDGKPLMYRKGKCNMYFISAAAKKSQQSAYMYKPKQRRGPASR